MQQEEKPSCLSCSLNKAGAVDGALPFLFHAQGDAAFTSLLSPQSTSGTSDTENVSKKARSCKVGLKMDFCYELQQKFVVKSEGTF